MKSYQQVIIRIDGECKIIDFIIKRALHAWNEGSKQPDMQNVFLDSVAFNLHGFYTGIERLFELIARYIDGELPSGKDWHVALLNQISNHYKDQRPAVISSSTKLKLDEFRRFRQIVRNVYTISLAPEKMKTMMANLPDLWKQLVAELHAFSVFLDDVIKTNEKRSGH